LKFFISFLLHIFIIKKYWPKYPCVAFAPLSVSGLSCDHTRA
jgi:hypothetical protein